MPAVAEITEMLVNARIQVEEASTSLRHHIDGVLNSTLSNWQTSSNGSATSTSKRANTVSSRNSWLNCINNCNRNWNNCPAANTIWSSLVNKRNCCGKTTLKAANNYLPSAAKQPSSWPRRLTNICRNWPCPAPNCISSCPHYPRQKPAPTAWEQIDFQICTNPGQPFKPLSRVASGGELSRISLAIQVVVAEKSATPTLVFDEVDVGIGGATADTVGGLLRQLGRTGPGNLRHSPATSSQPRPPSPASQQSQR